MVDLTVKNRAVQKWALDYYNLRFGALLAAMAVYAFRGSPTPDDPGYIEAMIGVLLIGAVGLGPLYHLSRLRFGGPLWHKSGQILLYYCISVPVVIGVVNGRDTGLILRDVLPFLFLMLPLFFYALLSRKGIYIHIVTAMVCFIGIAFSVRVLWPLDFKTILQATPSDPFYLGIAPTVLFAAIFLAGQGGRQIYRSFKAVPVLKGMALLLLSVLPLMTMMLIVQRASVGLCALAILVLLAVAFLKKPYRAMPLLILAALTLIAGWPYVTELFSRLAEKTALVGLNMRLQEALVVIKMISGSYWEVLFGKGWGTTIVSPAVGGVSVNFTHSLLTTYWLKTGLVGLALVFLYLLSLALQLLTVVRYHPVVALAIAMPVAIDVFLYASFKSLDFGLLLLLIPLWATYARSLQGKA